MTSAGSTLVIPTSHSLGFAGMEKCWEASCTPQAIQHQRRVRGACAGILGWSTHTTHPLHLGNGFWGVGTARHFEFGQKIYKEPIQR